MKIPLLLTLAGTLAVGHAAAEEVYRDQHVRFTLVDDGTVRMEYAPDGQFVDNKSFVAVIRQYPAVRHTLKATSRQVTITTDKMRIVYKKSDRPFDAQNLSIAYNTGGVKGTWTPGTTQKANLKGTYRTLDGFSGDTNFYSHEPMPLEDGILARDGWTLIDDSDGLLFTDEPDGWDWVATRPASNQGADLYFMAYGHNYKEALKSYTRFAGNMPLPPRYTFGYWWSRYWSYSDQDFRTLIDNFHRRGIPLDVPVIDMDWHPISPEAGGGWTGWDWNEHLFPDYRQFLAYLDEQGVKTTMNLHPADGVRPYEKKYADFLARYGRDANAQELREQWAPDGAVEWLGSDKQMVSALFDTYLHPYMDEGVDFWWLDWQQWLNDKAVPQLSNTWWCNYLFFSDMERHGDKRPMLYHRWGGLGNHRYQIGFSGDALMTWESLAYLPYFNATASNVLYGYWSHDIGGHMNAKSGMGINAEMYMRAMQMGQYLPVLRSHSTKDPSLNKEPWAFDNVMQQRIVDAITGRYTLVPYIYTMARHAHETGVSLCRPLYYEWPDAEEAYSCSSQYSFGDNMLIAPITQPADADGLVTLSVWLPEGEWFDTAKGELITSDGRTTERTYSLDEYPVFVKGGSILPYYEHAQNLGTNDQDMLLRIFPSAASAEALTATGSFDLYEDNGEDNRYATESAIIPLSYQRTAAASLVNLRVTIGARQGSYAGMPAERHYRLALPATMPPTAVTMDGKALSWHFDAQSVEIVVDLGTLDCSKAAVIDITYPQSDALNAFKGRSQRLQAAIADYKQQNAGIVYTPDFGTLENTALRLHYRPADADAILASFSDVLGRLDGVLHEQMQNADHEARFKRLLK